MILQSTARQALEARGREGFTPQEDGLQHVGPASEALAQYRFVTIVAEEYAYPAANGDYVDGVTVTAAALDAQVNVCGGGLCKITLGATIAADVLVGSDTNGKAIAAAATKFAAAKLLEGGDADDVVWCRVFSPGTFQPA